jgi:hypothetical protein
VEEIIIMAFRESIADWKAKKFPKGKHTCRMRPEEAERFKDMLCKNHFKAEGT